MRRLNQRGSGAIEILLILVLVAILGFTGWFVWHARQATDETLNDTNKSETAVTAAVSTFAECQKTTGSKILTTYPEQCVTKNGETFTNPDQASTQPTKAAADSPMPAAGTCITTAAAIVTVTLNPDIPNPRCVQVTKNQSLELKNASGQAVTAALGSKSVTIPAGQSGTIAMPFGEYLQNGDHVVQTGLYGGSGPEVYLPAD